MKPMQIQLTKGINRVLFCFVEALLSVLMMSSCSRNQFRLYDYSVHLIAIDRDTMYFAYDGDWKEWYFGNERYKRMPLVYKIQLKKIAKNLYKTYSVDKPKDAFLGAWCESTESELKDSVEFTFIRPNCTTPIVASLYTMCSEGIPLSVMLSDSATIRFNKEELGVDIRDNYSGPVTITFSPPIIDSWRNGLTDNVAVFTYPSNINVSPGHSYKLHLPNLTDSILTRLFFDGDLLYRTPRKLFWKGFSGERCYDSDNTPYTEEEIVDYYRIRYLQNNPPIKREILSQRELEILKQQMKEERKRNKSKKTKQKKHK